MSGGGGCLWDPNLLRTAWKSWAGSSRYSCEPPQCSSDELRPVEANCLTGRQLQFQECCWSRAWGWALLHSAAENCWVLLLDFCWPCRKVTSCPLPSVLGGTHSPACERTQVPLGANSGFGAVAVQVTGSSIRVYCGLLTNWQLLSWWSVCEYPTESLILFLLPVDICCPRRRASYCTLCVRRYGYSSSMQIEIIYISRIFSYEDSLLMPCIPQYLKPLLLFSNLKFYLEVVLEMINCKNLVLLLKALSLNIADKWLPVADSGSTIDFLVFVVIIMNVII